MLQQVDDLERSKSLSAAANRSLASRSAHGFKPVVLVKNSYLDRDMCKFESSQKDESRAQSSDSSKAHSKSGAFNQHELSTVSSFVQLGVTSRDAT